MQSKVHPTYKTKYRVASPAYNQALVRRGDVTVWLSSEAIAAWTPRRSGRRGGQRRYSDLAIETALTLRLIYHLPLRQAEGFLHALFGMMRLDLSAPDYTTLSRRSQHLRRRLRPVPPGEGLHLVLDSTGLSIVGAGEWAAAKHGGRGRRGWRKLHLGVDQSGVIRVHTLTEETGDDATTGLDLLAAVDGPLVRVTADAAYDTVAVYETATARGATVIIPPAKTANISGHGPRSPARDRTITLVKQFGRRRWKKVSGYHRQGRVENAFFRYKSIIGDGLRARSPAGQGSEAVLGCEILPDDRPRPTSVDSAGEDLVVGIVRARRFVQSAIRRSPGAASEAPRPIPTDEGIHLVLDSTGLSIVGEGEWAAAKHGGRGRRGWRKLHLGVDRSGVIRVHTLTEETGDDATTALDLLTAVEGPLVRVTADAAYDTVAVYETARARGATVIIPPAKTANVSGHGPRSPARDRTITLVKQLGRRRWKKASGYHRQSRVENAFFRYKSIIGDGLRARSPAGQGSEVVLGCEILNRMTALGRPASYRIGR